jgi:integrase
MSVLKRRWRTYKGEIREAWIVDYVDQQGERHIETFAKKKDADDYQSAVKEEVRRGVHTAPSKSITFAEAADDWITYVESEGRERSTLDQYKQHARLHIVPRIGATKLALFTTPNCEKLRDDLVRELSRPMARKVLRSLKAILKDAKRRGNVAVNVASDTRITSLKREKRKIKAGVDFPLTNEIHKMLVAVDGRSRALLIVGAFAGLRSSELRGLRWKDVDFQGGKIRVEQRIDRYQKAGRPKSEAGDRDIPVMPLVMNTLREAQKAATGELVFANGAGNPENHANLVQRILHRAQRAAGWAEPRYKGLHTLRHYFAAWSLTRPEDGAKALP